jgi:hypothetical protein
MGIHRQQKATWPMRDKLRSPGAAWLSREHRVRFWETRGRDLSTDDAASAANVASAVGARRFRQCGGMSPFAMSPLSWR